MIPIQTLFIYDASAILLMLVLAYLSKRLGDALKIRRYYRLLYFAASVIVTAFLISLFKEEDFSKRILSKD